MTRLLEIDDLTIEFATRHGTHRAVDGASLHVEPGEIHGLVGESGCGKTVTGLSILGLLPESARVSAARFSVAGHDLLTASDGQLRSLRGRTVAMIFQDPTTSLNPVFTIGSQVIQVIDEHFDLPKAEAIRKASTMLSAVGLADAERILGSYPHQLSGGMRQRVMIALALVCEPQLLIADEPTTALDVTIQAQILHLLTSIRERFDLGIILITHDLGVVSQVADDVTVLYAGRVVESGPVSTYADPSHPYTQGLIGSIPTRDTVRGTLEPIDGSVPYRLGDSGACVFADRCPYVFGRCRQETPPLYEIGSRRFVACYLAEPT